MCRGMSWCCLVLRSFEEQKGNKASSEITDLHHPHGLRDTLPDPLIIKQSSKAVIRCNDRVSVPFTLARLLKGGRPASVAGSLDRLVRDPHRRPRPPRSCRAWDKPLTMSIRSLADSWAWGRTCRPSPARSQSPSWICQPARAGTFDLRSTSSFLLRRDGPGSCLLSATWRGTLVIRSCRTTTRASPGTIRDRAAPRPMVRVASRSPER